MNASLPVRGVTLKDRCAGGGAAQAGERCLSGRPGHLTPERMQGPRTARRCCRTALSPLAAAADASRAGALLRGQRVPGAVGALLPQPFSTGQWTSSWGFLAAPGAASCPEPCKSVSPGARSPAISARSCTTPPLPRGTGKHQGAGSQLPAANPHRSAGIAERAQAVAGPCGWVRLSRAAASRLGSHQRGPWQAEDGAVQGTFNKTTCVPLPCAISAAVHSVLLVLTGPRCSRDHPCPRTLHCTPTLSPRAPGAAMFAGNWVRLHMQ